MPLPVENVAGNGNQLVFLSLFLFFFCQNYLSFLLIEDFWPLTNYFLVFVTRLFFLGYGKTWLYQILFIDPNFVIFLFFLIDVISFVFVIFETFLVKRFLTFSMRFFLTSENLGPFWFSVVLFFLKIFLFLVVHIFVYSFINI